MAFDVTQEPGFEGQPEPVKEIQRNPNPLGISQKDLLAKLDWLGFDWSAEAEYVIYAYPLGESLSFYGLVYFHQNVPFEEVVGKAEHMKAAEKIGATELRNFIEVRFEGYRTDEKSGTINMKLTWLEGEFADRIAMGKRIQRIAAVSPRLALDVALQAIIEGGIHD